MIAYSVYPNATITVIARPRKGSWQSVLSSPCACQEEKDGSLFIQPQGIPIVQSLMICTQTQQQLSLRDPVRGRGNPFSRPLPPWRESRGKPSEGSPVYYIRFLFAGEPPAGRFLCRQRKRRKKPPKGTYFEAVPFGIPPRRRRGLRPLRTPTGDGGRENEDGRTGTGVTDCHNQ